MKYNSSISKWLLKNPNFIRKSIFLKLEKKFYGRYSQKYYPKNIKDLISIYLKNNKSNLKINIKKVKKIKNFKDPEYFEKLHRLEKINELSSKKAKINYISNWYKFYFPLVNLKKNEKYKLIWESYTISYRIFNIISFQKKFNLNLFNEYIKFEVLILLNKIEYFQKGINNHILKNSQALIFSGLYLEDKNLTKIGFKIFNESLKILINKNGLLRESSSSYQFLICNLLLETSEFIINHKQKPRKKLINLINKMLRACNFFCVKNKMVIFGDTTPDKSIKNLESNFVNYKKKFPKTSKFILGKKIKFITSKNNLNEFYRIQNKNILVFLKYHSKGVLKFLNHQHEDNFHFNLYYKNVPVLTDLNRLNYLNEDGTFSKYHNSVSVNNYGPLINNSRKYPIDFLESKNFLKINKNKNIYMESNCFKFVSSDYKWKRNISISDKYINLNDEFISKKNSIKKVYLHFYPTIKFSKKINNKIFFTNTFPKFKIELNFFDIKNKKLKINKSFYSNSYGSKINTLTLTFKNEQDKIFNNRVLIRFVD